MCSKKLQLVDGIFEINDRYIEYIPLLKNMMEGMDDDGELFPMYWVDPNQNGEVVLHPGVTTKLMERICEWIDYEINDMVSHPSTVVQDCEINLLGKYVIKFSAASNDQDDISDDVKWPRRLWAKDYRNERIPMFMNTPAAKALLEKYLAMDFKEEIEPMLEPLKFLGVPPYVDPLNHEEAPYRYKMSHMKPVPEGWKPSLRLPECPKEECKKLFMIEKEDVDRRGQVICPECKYQFFPAVDDNGFELKGIVLFEQFLYDVMKYWCDFNLEKAILAFGFTNIDKERLRTYDLSKNDRVILEKYTTA